jgi:polysaccharide export outer membrane protein
MKQLTVAVFFSALAFSAAAQQPATISSTAAIGPRDVIDLKVVEDATMNERLSVGDDGQIVIKYLGKVPVAGLTASQIETRLKTLLEAQLLATATVSVQVVEYASQPISIVGAVVRPGQIRSRGTPTLIQAITEAGGLAENHGRSLYIVRNGRNGLSEQLEIDIADLMENGNPMLNVPLAPNDLINVPVDTPITIYLLGEVMKPGKSLFRSSQTPTLLQAIADAGGPTDRASSTAVILRRTNGQQERIRVNYRDILNGRKDDIVLSDGDTINIPASFF